MSTAIWWIRRDVRLSDNQALHASLAGSDQVVPLFVLDPTLINSSYASARRTAFLLGGLQALNERLQQLGSHLIVRSGNPTEVVPALSRELNGAEIFAERDYSPYATARDRALLERDDVSLTLVEGASIRPVGSVTKDDGAPYTVFTPYSRRWKQAPPIERHELLPVPQALNPLPDLPTELVPAPPRQANHEAFPPGEIEALRRLTRFTDSSVEQPIFDYAKLRDRPDLDGTSQLSPYLRFGMISARQAAVEAQTAIRNAPNAEARAGANTWLDELIWRDFYLTILAAFPRVRSGNFRADYDTIAWHNDRAEFDAWCAGRTGYPFIDAAMRQLLHTGWMHNRARMAVASFLVKDLLIDWRWGERWFMQQLLDGDPAANNGGWQWAAGTGTDAAPYFRIFNPVSQGNKHDPNGDYVRMWVPELSGVPQKFIHEPWKMGPGDQIRANCEVGTDYPRPIVDHKWARERTLAAYKAARASASPM